MLVTHRLEDPVQGIAACYEILDNSQDPTGSLWAIFSFNFFFFFNEKQAESPNEFAFHL